MFSPAVGFSATQSVLNPAFVFMRNPRFGWPIAAAQPATSFVLPALISPVAAPTDQTVFTEPQDSSKLHYLTEYGIATRGSGSSLCLWGTFAPSSGGSRLRYSWRM